MIPCDLDGVPGIYEVKELIDITPVDQIFSFFRDYGSRHYGENVSELKHALQTAEFAQQFDEPDRIVLSCLLHDYGHIVHDLGEDIAQHGIDAKHEIIGGFTPTRMFFGFIASSKAAATFCRLNH